MKSVVSLIRCEDFEDLEKPTRMVMGQLGDMEAIITQGATVMIKPNFTGALPPETGAASDPGIAKALARLALEAGASKVIIAEGIGAGHVSLKDVRGLREISAMKGVEVVDLNDEQTEAVDAVGATAMGFDPTSILYLKHAVEKGIGVSYRIEDIDIRGASISDVCRKFEEASVSSTWK